MNSERRKAPKITSVVISILMALGTVSCSAESHKNDQGTTTETTQRTVNVGEPVVVDIKPIRTKEAKMYGDQEFVSKGESYRGKVYCGGNEHKLVQIRPEIIDGKHVKEGTLFSNNSNFCSDKYLTGQEATITVIDFVKITAGN